MDSTRQLLGQHVTRATGVGPHRASTPPSPGPIEGGVPIEAEVPIEDGVPIKAAVSIKTGGPIEAGPHRGRAPSSPGRGAPGPHRVRTPPLFKSTYGKLYSANNDAGMISCFLCVK